MSARSILLEMFLAAERDAINSYATWTGREWVFNDRVWRDDDQNFPMFRRARIFLGLKPFKFSGRAYPTEGRSHSSTLKPEGER